MVTSFFSLSSIGGKNNIFDSRLFISMNGGSFYKNLGGLLVTLILIENSFFTYLFEIVPYIKNDPKLNLSLG